MKSSVSDRRSRTLSPFSQVTVSEWPENRLKEGPLEVMRGVMQVDPANARVTAVVLPITRSNKALIQTKPAALEGKLTF